MPKKFKKNKFEPDSKRKKELRAKGWKFIKINEEFSPDPDDEKKVSKLCDHFGRFE